MGYGNSLIGVTLLRPEVMELINVSPRTISLKNWTLTFNSGSFINDIGQIDYSYGYGGGPSGRSVNPSIAGNGYFYLVNNMKLFNADFGTGRPERWGQMAGQQVPVWEIPTDSWGIQYKIARTVAPDLNTIRMYLANEHFKRDQFRGEIVEMVDTIGSKDHKATVHGTRYIIDHNDRDWVEFRFDKGQWNLDHWMPTGGRWGRGIDVAMILGMPAKGGIVSMTLKNEYKQITARTVEYAYRDEEPRKWYGQTTEKRDPTHYLWTIQRTPSISGNPLLARNRAMRSERGAQVKIKNGPYNSVAELRHVRHGEQFQNIGEGGSSAKSMRTLGAVMDVFYTGHIRLEAGDELCDRSGWSLAADRVRSARNGQIVAEQGGWEIDQWRGHSLTFMTGPLRGESFPVSGNTRTSLSLRDANTIARSTPKQLPPNPQPGDRFSLGPGYTTPFSYTRSSNTKGEWRWRKRLPVPGVYDLYIVGLNDAINTTEMLEENRNAPLDVSVWNYKTGAWDTICQRRVYGKDDRFRAGAIGPQHVSPDGDFRLQIVAHDVVAEDTHDINWDEGMRRAMARRSGYAWFNYAALSPAPVMGRVNVNTADPRLLRSLPGITPSLAEAIANGRDSNNRPQLKPYRSPGDLLAVKGMSEDILERCVNLIAFDSANFTVQVDVQAVRDVNHDGVFDPNNEPVLAQKHSRSTVQVGFDEERHRITVLGRQ
jgi:hypothetical protein